MELDVFDTFDALKDVMDMGWEMGNAGGLSGTTEIRPLNILNDISTCFISWLEGFKIIK